MSGWDSRWKKLGHGGSPLRRYKSHKVPRICGFCLVGVRLLCVFACIRSASRQQNWRKRRQIASKTRARRFYFALELFAFKFGVWETGPHVPILPKSTRNEFILHSKEERRPQTHKKLSIVAHCTQLDVRACGRPWKRIPTPSKRWKTVQKHLKTIKNTWK